MEGPSMIETFGIPDLMDALVETLKGIMEIFTVFPLNLFLAASLGFLALGFFRKAKKS